MERSHLDGAKAVTPLFRRSALEHAGNTLHGNVMLARPPSLLLVAAIYAIVAAAGVAMFAVRDVAHRAACSETGPLANHAVSTVATPARAEDRSRACTAAVVP